MSVERTSSGNARSTKESAFVGSAAHGMPEEELVAHASDQDLIASLYTGEAGGSHVTCCSSCQQRLSAFRVNRERIEQEQVATLDVSAVRLAGQRRQIYARLSQPVSFWSKFSAPRWVSAGATAMVLGGGLLVVQHQEMIHFSKQRVHVEDRISDADLAQEVSSLSQNVEAMPAEPLKGLFE